MAEYDWKGLYQVLEKLLRSPGQLAEYNRVLHVLNGGTSTEKHKILNDNLHILNELFVLRKKAWFAFIIERGLDITGDWYRFKFSKSQ